MSGEKYTDLIDCISTALDMSKYIINYSGNYKKDKKKAEKMLEDLECGNFEKYIKGDNEDE